MGATPAYMKYLRARPRGQRLVVLLFALYHWRHELWRTIQFLAKIIYVSQKCSLAARRKGKWSSTKGVL